MLRIIPEQPDTTDSLHLDSSLLAVDANNATISKEFGNENEFSNDYINPK